jgi:transcriptional regulator with XRE-family HTH domain
LNTPCKTAEKLRDPEYRKAFVASQIYIGIPFQIRAMLKSRRGWTQRKLAEKTGIHQPTISCLITPGKTRPNIETLRRVAEAFDCGLMVRFVPFSELTDWSDRFDPENFNVPSFMEELKEVK